MNVRSLHVKVSVSVAAAALFVVVVSSHVAYRHAYENSFADSKRSVQQLLETVSTTAAIAAYVGNRELAQQVAEGLSINDIVTGAQITVEGGVLGQQGAAFKKSSSHSASLKLTAPFNDKEIVGEVAVQPNLPLIIERARESALATTVGLAAQAAVVGLLVLVLVYWMMSRPLARLSGKLHRIIPGDGNRVAVAARHRNDEIGILTEDINALLGTVEEMLDEERQLRRRVELLEHRFRGIFEDSSAGIFLVHEQGVLATANPAFFKIAGLDEQPPEALADIDIINAIFVDPEQAQALVREALVSQQPCAADLKVVVGEKNKQRWVHCIFSPAGAVQEKSTVEGVMYDVTQRKLDEEHTRELAEKDGLTGLFNRQMVDTALDALVARATAAERGLVVMMIDLDGFKQINDTYGHDAGDETLRAVAKRLRSCVRDTDIVARLGGDEFMVVLDQTRSIATATNIAQQIIDLHQSPVEIQQHVQQQVGVSIGIAVYPDHGGDVSSLRRHADQAMYAVKQRGKNNYAFYDRTGVYSIERAGSASINPATE